MERRYTGALTSLRILNLRGCDALVGLPAEVGALVSLRALSLKSCAALTSLPKEMSALTGLQTLDVTDCDALVDMPDLSGLPELNKPQVAERSHLHSHLRSHALFTRVARAAGDVDGRG